MAPIRVGFIGFGEVASVLATPLRKHGASVSAYEVLLDRGGAEVLRQRAGKSFAAIVGAGKVAGSAGGTPATLR